MLELITGQLVYDFWALAGIFPCDTSRWAYALEPVHSFSSAHRYQRLDGRLFTWLGASYPVGLITTNEWGVDGTKAAQCVGAPGLPFIAPTSHARRRIRCRLHRPHRPSIVAAHGLAHPPCAPLLCRGLAKSNAGALAVSSRPFWSSQHFPPALRSRRCWPQFSSRVWTRTFPVTVIATIPPDRLRVRIRARAHQAKTFRVLICATGRHLVLFEDTQTQCTREFPARFSLEYPDPGSSPRCRNAMSTLSAMRSIGRWLEARPRPRAMLRVSRSRCGK
ncbi:hypothetical protein B0H14DRAFT_873677 [Mycena olivaceomarginata]|nr:hypothetical protein B0H14DRAFT_873677 [Mycena olivaceomarginata]